MTRDKIEPTVILTLSTDNLMNIPIIITNFTGMILSTTHVEKLGFSNYDIRKKIKEVIDRKIAKYGVDTILIEQNQLFLDKMDKYPDPMVLRNILLSFGIQTTIEDNYWESVKYIMEIPKFEWKKTVLNKRVEYAIDLYKSHILFRKDIKPELLKEIEDNNYYEALCLSESLLYSKFLKKQYQINK